MKRFSVAVFAAVAAAFALGLVVAAAELPPMNDGSDHGDPPFLTESGWKPLLNGRNLDGWQLVDPTKKGQWVVTKGVIWGGTANPAMLAALPDSGRSHREHGLRPAEETPRTSTPPRSSETSSCTSSSWSRRIPTPGVYMDGLYETQIWDSWGFVPRLLTDQCGAMYHYGGGPINGVDGGIGPKARADRPPGQWQSFHFWFQAPRFDASGKKIVDARFIRILHNGQVIHENVERLGPTVAAMKIPEAPHESDHAPGRSRRGGFPQHLCPPA